MNNILKEAVKVAAIVAPVLVVLAAVLPGLHVSAAAVAVVTAASSAVAAFLRFAKDHGVTPKSVAYSVAHRVR